MSNKNENAVCYREKLSGLNIYHQFSQLGDRFSATRITGNKRREYLYCTRCGELRELKLGEKP